MFRVALFEFPSVARMAAAMLALIFCQIANAQQAGTGQFMDYPGTVLNGLITATVPLDMEQCRRVCSDRSGCVGFDHSSATNECRIYGAVSGARDDTSFNASTRYPVPGYREATVQTAQPTADFLSRTFTHDVNFDLTGFDLEQSPATSLAQCEDLCRGNAECRAFTFNAWNENCFLKNGVGKLRLDPRATTGLISGSQHPGYRETQVVMEYYSKSRISGTQLGQPRVAGSRDQCENLCWERQQCAAFTFIRAERECRLYEHADNRFPRNGFESGAKVQPRD